MIFHLLIRLIIMLFIFYYGYAFVDWVFSQKSYRPQGKKWTIADFIIPFRFYFKKVSKSKNSTSDVKS